LNERILMNAMIMSALTVLGIAGVFGAAQSDPKKSMDECCAKPTDSCCSPKPDNCCEKPLHGMKDHHPLGPGQAENKPAGDSHCGSNAAQSFREHDGHRGGCGDQAGGGASCMK
jgi:hypothetical protein